MRRVTAARLRLVLVFIFFVFDSVGVSRVVCRVRMMSSVE